MPRTVPSRVRNSQSRSRTERVDRNDQRDEDKTSANSHAPRGARGSKDLIGFSCHAFIPVAPMQGAWIEIP